MRGGARVGAGRPLKYGCGLVQMWVPVLLVKAIRGLMKKLETKQKRGV